MNKRQYLFLGAIAAIGFAAAFVIGSGVIALTGIPMTGSLVSGLVFFTVFVIGIRGVPRFGSATIAVLLFSILSIPTSIFGPPGIYKVLLGALVGLLFDLMIHLFKKKDWGYIIGAALAEEVAVLGVLAATLILGLPGAEKMKSLILIMLVAQFVVGFVSGYLGIYIYNKKLAALNLFKRLAE